MDRRTFVRAVAGGVLAAPTAAFPQQPATVHRIGFLGAETASHDQERVNALRESLRELGYVDGENLFIEVRLADGYFDRLPTLALELVARKVEVIVTDGVKSTVGARRATATTPIVASNMGDAVNAGLVASYAKPGGKVTGTALFSPEVMAKRLEFLKEAAPRIAKVAVLVNPDNPNFDAYLRVLRSRAVPLRVNIEPIVISSAGALEPAFLAMAKQKVDAVIVHNDTMFLANAKTIVNLIEKQGIASAGWTAFGNAGGLIGYGAGSSENWRYIAVYVDKILKGARPADLPVQQPTKFLLVINLRTARALSLTIPQALLWRADEVIQ